MALQFGQHEKIGDISAAARARAPCNWNAIDVGKNDARQLFGDRSGETSLLGLAHAGLFGQQWENSAFPSAIGNVG